MRSRSWVIDFNRFSGKAQVGRATLCPATALILYDATKVMTYMSCQIKQEMI